MNSEQSPSWEQLVDWVDGRLLPEDAKIVEDWIYQDSRSTATLSWLRAFKRAGSEVSLDEPPHELRSALRAIFAVHASRVTEARLPSIVEHLIAALSFDSGLQPGLAGARGGSEATRQLVYSTEAADVTLTVQDGADGLQIYGQLLPMTDVVLDSFRAQLQQDSDTIEQTFVDTLGQFTFSSLDSNTYQLTLESDTLTIFIESVELWA